MLSRGRAYRRSWGVIWASRRGENAKRQKLRNRESHAAGRPSCTQKYNNSNKTHAGAQSGTTMASIAREEIVRLRCATFTYNIHVSPYGIIYDRHDTSSRADGHDFRVLSILPSNKCSAHTAVAGEECYERALQTYIRRPPSHTSMYPNGDKLPHTGRPDRVRAHGEKVVFVCYCNIYVCECVCVCVHRMAGMGMIRS